MSWIHLRLHQRETWWWVDLKERIGAEHLRWCHPWTCDPPTLYSRTLDLPSMPSPKLTLLEFSNFSRWRFFINQISSKFHDLQKGEQWYFKVVNKKTCQTGSLTMCQHGSFRRWHDLLKDIDQLRCCTITNSMSFYTKTMFLQMAHSLAIWGSETGWNGWGLFTFAKFHAPLDCGFCWTSAL